MIDIIVPTRRSTIPNPTDADPAVFSFVRKALNLHHHSQEDLVPIIEKTPVVEMTTSVIAQATNAKKTPYNVIISENKNGFIAAVNDKLTQSKNDVVLLNDDVFVTPGWLEKLVNHPDGDIRGCKILYPDGSVQHAGGSLSSAYSGIHIGRYHCDLGQFDAPQPVVYTTFACVYIKRKVIDAVGLLDTDYGLGYFDDIDYCCQARKLGFKTVYVPVPVVHLERTSMDQVDAIKDHYETNRQLFVKKWVNDETKFKYLFVN